MKDLSELIEKVRGATGADRELDGDIAEMAREVPASFIKRSFRQPALWSDGGPGLRARTWLAPHYTGSLDAIRALIEAKLPGWEWEVRKTGYAELRHPSNRRFDVPARAATPAVGLTLAFLLAMQATGAK